MPIYLGFISSGITTTPMVNSLKLPKKVLVFVERSY
jgi:hypothetical protein